jgi:predicted transcriptional regulator of viral defense system
VDRPGKPSWDELYRVAAEQRGYFTTQHAEAAGYSPQLLLKYLRNGRVVRARRGVYRLVHFPAGTHEDLMVLWLWSTASGVFSHQTALFLHGISDRSPAERHLTVPLSWRTRRLLVPPGVSLHFADFEPVDRTHVEGVPVTSKRRTLDDCAVLSSMPEPTAVAARRERFPNSGTDARASIPVWSERLETRLL